MQIGADFQKSCAARMGVPLSIIDWLRRPQSANGSFWHIKTRFGRPHLTKQPTGNRTDSSLSSRPLGAFRNSRPRCYQAWLTLPVFLLLDIARARQRREAPDHAHLCRQAGSQRSHFPLGEGNCRSGDGLGQRKVTLGSLSEPLR